MRQHLRARPPPVLVSRFRPAVIHLSDTQTQRAAGAAALKGAALKRALKGAALKRAALKGAAGAGAEG